jgi:hypothetical protein
MVPLWVVAVYLLAGVPDLLDDEEVRFGLDDPLDPLLLMPGQDDEVVALLNYALIAGGRDLDRLDTGSPAALAMKRKGGGHSVLLGTLLDPPVHIAEDLFVACGSFSEVHPRDP